MAKSRRYYRTVNKIQGQGIKVGKRGVEMVYDTFNIEPGQSSWVDMPEEYKKAYMEYKKKLDAKRKAEEEARKRHKIDDEKLRARIVEMERKLFAEKNKPLKDFVNDGISEKDPLAEKKKDIMKVKPPKRKPMEMPNLDQSRCNFIDSKFFERKREVVRQTLTIKKERPKILLIADVCGWAWWNKSKYLQMYLEDDYDIDVICVLGPEASGINRGKYNLYLTYGYSYVHMLQGVARRKRVTGITAHRPIKMLKPYMELAKYVHANSKMLIDDLDKMNLPSDIRKFYVPNGVDEEIFKPEKPIGEGKTLVAGHIGKECPAKGQQEFIIPAMRKANVDSFTNMSDYRSRKPFCEMGSHYQNMDVFIVASVEDGTPNPALEAAACGRPIISNRIGNMPQFIKDGYNGFLVERNVNAYVKKLKLLNNDRDLLKQMGENARKTIFKEWTWKHQAENWRKMFKNIIGR